MRLICLSNTRSPRSVICGAMGAPHSRPRKVACAFAISLKERTDNKTTTNGPRDDETWRVYRRLRSIETRHYFTRTNTYITNTYITIQHMRPIKYFVLFNVTVDQHEVWSFPAVRVHVCLLACRQYYAHNRRRPPTDSILCRNRSFKKKERKTAYHWWNDDYDEQTSNETLNGIDRQQFINCPKCRLGHNAATARTRESNGSKISESLVPVATVHNPP